MSCATPMSLPLRELIQRRYHTCSEISGDIVPGLVDRPSTPLRRAHCKETRDRDDGNSGRLPTGLDPWLSEPRGHIVHVYVRATQSHECA